MTGVAGERPLINAAINKRCLALGGLLRAGRSRHDGRQEVPHRRSASCPAEVMVPRLTHRLPRHLLPPLSPVTRPSRHGVGAQACRVAHASVNLPLPASRIYIVVGRRLGLAGGGGGGGGGVGVGRGHDVARVRWEH